VKTNTTKSTRKNAAQISADNKAQKVAKATPEPSPAVAAAIEQAKQGDSLGAVSGLLSDKPITTKEKELKAVASTKAALTEIQKDVKQHPVVNAPSLMTPMAILERDLSHGSLNLFKAAAEVAGDWNDTPPTYEYMPAKGSTIKKDEGHLTDLKQKSLITTSVDSDNTDIVWTTFTKRGQELLAHLAAKEELANTPLVVDGTKPAAKTHKQIATEAIGFPPAATPVNAKPAKVLKPKVDRAKLRYAAISECMTDVKADTWRKASYKPMLKQLQVNYPELYAKIKTVEKVQAYSVGIVDFCLAACRKMNLRPE
jgi:hypothetical protein